MLEVRDEQAPYRIGLPAVDGGRSDVLLDGPQEGFVSQPALRGQRRTTVVARRAASSRTRGRGGPAPTPARPLAW